MHSHEELKKYFEDNEMMSIWPFASPKVVEAIQMEIAQRNVDENTFRLGESKLGGFPHLPESIVWDDLRYKYENEHDVHLSFILQLNFEEVSKHDRLDLVPKKGMLYFFSVHGGFYVNDLGNYVYIKDNYHYSDTYKCIYIEDPGSLSVAYPDFKPTEQEYLDYSKTQPSGFNSSNPQPFYADRLFPACKLNFKEILSLPSHSFLLSLHEDNPDFPGWDDNAWIPYEKARGTRYHGYMEILGYGGNAYQGGSYDLFDAGKDAEYHLLFQLDSVNGMDWRNCQGSMLVHISKEDLLAKRLDRIDIFEDF